MKNVLLTVALLIMTVVARAERIGILTELSRPNQLEITDGVISVIDGAKLFVYDKTSMKLIRSFGKEGQGPGEFNLHPEQGLMYEYLTDSVFINSYNKLASFSLTGQLQYEKVVPFWILQAIPLNGNYIISKYTANKDRDRVVIVSLYDQDLKEKKVFYESVRPNPLKERKVNLPPEHVFLCSHKGAIYLCDLSAPNIKILKFNNRGELKKTIEMDVPKLEVDEAFMKEATDWLLRLPHLRSAKLDPKNMVKFPKFFPPVKNILLDGDLIYLHTFKKKDGLVQCLVLDFDGNLVKELYLPSGNRDIIQVIPKAIFDIHRNVYYYLWENEDTEEWELHTLNLAELMQQK